MASETLDGAALGLAQVARESLEVVVRPLAGTRAPFALRLERVRSPLEAATATHSNDLWGFVWGCSSVAADAVAACDLDTSHVLEIGAGLGLVSLAARRAGAARVTTTDIAAAALALFRDNVARNELAPVQTHRLDWFKPVDPETGLCGAVDLLVGSDIIYLRSCLRPVLQVISATLAERGVALLVDPGRPTAEGLADLCDEQRLVCEHARFEFVENPLRTLRMCDTYLIARSRAALESALAQQLRAAVAALRERCVEPDRAGSLGYCLPVDGK